MSCTACAAAQTDAHHAIYQSDCRGCRVRALASGPTYFESARADRLTPQYRAGLRALFSDAWQQGHADVKAEHARLQRLKGHAHG